MYKIIQYILSYLPGYNHKEHDSEDYVRSVIIKDNGNIALDLSDTQVKENIRVLISEVNKYF